MQRILQPELLDSLPPDHPDAVHSRRDLLAINALMGNHRWFARTLPRLVRPGERVLEIGAGRGELSARLARRGIETSGLDFCPKPHAWPGIREWHRADLRTFSDYARYPVIFGNLIFHHFNECDLAALGAILRSTARLIIASEPTRRPISQRLFRAIAPVLGLNHVTQHDGAVSIAAGFIGNELPHALGLIGAGEIFLPEKAIRLPETGSGSQVEAVTSTNACNSTGQEIRVHSQNDSVKAPLAAGDEYWDITCSETILGAYRMIAVRRE